MKIRKTFLLIVGIACSLGAGAHAQLPQLRIPINPTTHSNFIRPVIPVQSDHTFQF
jgi:hypothetical protein